MKALIFLSSIAVLFLGAAPEAAATVPGAEWNIDTSLNSASFFGATGVTAFRAQTFEAVQSGRVETVRLRLARTSGHDVALRLSLYAAGQDGLPTGDALMTGDFSPAGIAVNELNPVAFDFDDNDGFLIEAGERYALTMAAAEPGTESLFYANAGFGEQATYADGQALRSADGATWFTGDLDLAFQVLVDETVPVRPVSWGRVKRLY